MPTLMVLLPNEEKKHFQVGSARNKCSIYGASQKTIACNNSNPKIRKKGAMLLLSC